jgi:hypothetical protein
VVAGIVMALLLTGGGNQGPTQAVVDLLSVGDDVLPARLLRD